MPVADHLVAAWIHVNAGLTGEEEHDQGGKEHHVARQPEEDEETNAMQAFPRAAPLALPVIVASTSSAAGGSPVNGRFSANSWFFPFYFRWGAREGNGHREASEMLVERLLLPMVGRTWKRQRCRIFNRDS
jgi:hypothetical protein